MAVLLCDQFTYCQKENKIYYKNFFFFYFEKDKRIFFLLFLLFFDIVFCIHIKLITSTELLGKELFEEIDSDYGIHLGRKSI
jgi:hypothetical protein